MIKAVTVQAAVCDFCGAIGPSDVSPDQASAAAVALGWATATPPAQPDAPPRHLCPPCKGAVQTALAGG